MKNEKVIIGSTAALCGTSVCNKRGCNFFFFFYSSMSTACLIYSIAICCGEKNGDANAFRKKTRFCQIMDSMRVQFFPAKKMRTIAKTRKAG
jgi:hypothetical protein